MIVVKMPRNKTTQEKPKRPVVDCLSTIEKLPPEVIRYTRRFLSIHDVRGTHTLEKKLTEIFETTHTFVKEEYSEDFGRRVMTKFPAYYQYIRPRSVRGIKWDATNSDKEEFYLRHSNKNEPFQYTISLQDEADSEGLIYGNVFINPQNKLGQSTEDPDCDIGFNEAQEALMESYFEHEFPEYGSGVQEDSASVYICYDAFPPSRYTLDISPKALFEELHETVLKIKRDVKHMNRTVRIQHDPDSETSWGRPWVF